jgi:uncharacterized protein (UPF0303 family)
VFDHTNSSLTEGQSAGAVKALLGEVRSWSKLFNFKKLDHDSARRIGQAVAEVAEFEQLPVTVAVFLGEQRIYHAAFTGTTAANDEWIRRKRNAALRHDMSSLEFLLTQSQSSRPPEWLDARDFAIAGGAIPLRVRGSMVGTVVLSGLSNSATADDEVIVKGIRAARQGEAQPGDDWLKPSRSQD